jgi:uncharacterized protein YqgC (DUF456 family)
MMPGLVVLVALLMIAGIIGSVLPILPSTPLILLGAVIYAFGTGFDPVGPWHLAALTLLVLVAQALDYLSSALGTRKLGGSRWAVAGALIGALVGLFFGPVGILVGPVLGAVALELYHRKELRAGLTSGAGAVLGMILGAVAKLVVATTMVGLFTYWALSG